MSEMFDYENLYYNKAVSEDLQETLPRPWAVYALSCEGGSLYIGVTNDIERRIKAHANGTGISCRSKQDAMALEYRLKKLKKPQKLRELGLDENAINSGIL